jgi:hypothetical protein
MVLDTYCWTTHFLQRTVSEEKHVISAFASFNGSIWIHLHWSHPRLLHTNKYLVVLTRKFWGFHGTDSLRPKLSSLSCPPFVDLSDNHSCNLSIQINWFLTLQHTLTMKTEITCSSKTLTTYKNTWWHNPEDHNLYSILLVSSSD